MSERLAEVIEICLEKHPNADSLSLQRIGGFCVVVNTASWAEKKLAVYIPPETIVDTTRPEFSYLSVPNQNKTTVKVKKLRGIPSMGCLVDCPEGFKVGDNLWEHFQLEHHEPEFGYTIDGDFVKGPENWQSLSKYDVENLRSSKYRNLFIDDEEVIVTEKINGSNLGIVFSDGEIHVRSRRGFRKPPETESDYNEFWRIGDSYNIREWCKANPDHMLYGEVYSHVKGFKYDGTNSVKFRCFDVQKVDRSFMSYDEIFTLPKADTIEYVPLVARMKFDFEELLEIAEKPSLLGNPICEGIVIKPVVERRDYRLGRVLAKVISNRYSEKI